MFGTHTHQFLTLLHLLLAISNCVIIPAQEATSKNSQYQPYFIRDTSKLGQNGLYLDQQNGRQFGFGQELVMVPLKFIQYRLEIVNTVILATINQYYQNPTDKFINVQFCFPLNPQSAIYKLTAQFNGKLIQGIIKSKQQAQKQFLSSKNSQNLSFLSQLDKKSRDIVRMKISSIPPKQKILISLSLIQQLSLSMNTFLYLQIPSTISPRYTNFVAGQFGQKMSISTKNQEKLANANIDSPLKLHYARNVPYRWNFDIFIKSSKRVAMYRSTTHQLQQKWRATDGKEIHLTLDMQRENFPNRDFVFYYATEHFQIPSYAYGENQNYSAVLVSFIPRFMEIDLDEFQEKNRTLSNQTEIDIKSAKGEFIFVLDRSGSMNTLNRIEKAKKALKIFIKSLPEDSYFNIMSFGSTFTSIFKTSQKYSNQILFQTLDSIQKMLSNMGGTNIFPPFSQIFNQPLIPTYPRTIFVLTDGQVSNPEQVLSLISSKIDRNYPTTKIYALGLGNGASGRLIQGMAQLGTGRWEMMTDKIDIQEKVIGLLNSAITPVATEFALEIQGIYEGEWDAYPEPGQVKFLGKDKIAKFYISFKKKLQHNIIVSFSYKDSFTTKTHKSSLQITPNSQNFPLISKMAQFKILRSLQNLSKSLSSSIPLKYNPIFSFKNQSQQIDYKHEAEQYSINHQILSIYTSFIGSISYISDDQKDRYKNIGSSQIIVPIALPQQYLERPLHNIQIFGNSLKKDQNTKISSVQTKNQAPIKQNQQNALKTSLTKEQKQLNSFQQARKSAKISVGQISLNKDKILQDVVQVQNSDGSWNDNELFESILGDESVFNIEQIEKVRRIRDSSDQSSRVRIVTYTVLYWMQKKQIGSKYLLIVKKAKSWLKGFVVPEDLLQVLGKYQVNS